MSSATANEWPEQPAVEAPESRFRTWRRTRPFWAGLLAMFAGLPILYFPYAQLSLGGLTMAMSTTAGAGALLIGLLMIALGLTAWFQPLVRTFCGVAVTILSLISIPVANLGGFGAGLIPGLLAGGMLVAWAPLPEPAAAEPALAEAAQEQPAQAEFAEQPAQPELAVAEHVQAEQHATEQHPADQHLIAQHEPVHEAAEPGEQR